MGKPRHWPTSGCSGSAGVSRALRRRLAATTILAVAPFLGYGRQALADCIVATSPAFICSGTTTATQNITTIDADVSTAPGFNLTAPTGNGINIQADGHLQFTDENASPITATNGTGLFVYSTGDSAGNNGAITIVTNGDIAGEDGDGIFARSISQTGDHLTITTVTGSAVTGSDDGIEALNYGGDLTITADGTVTGETDDGINAFNAGIYDPTGNGRDLRITTGAESVITGYDDGIIARNNGTGDLIVTANGEVTGNGLGPTAGYGINAFNSTNGGDLRITTGADSVIHGANGGIDVENNGDGDLIMEINGQVTSDDNAIDADNDEGRNLTITTGAQSVITGGTYGITTLNRGAGNLEVTIHGQVTGEDGDGIDARGSADSEDFTIITGTGSEVTGSAIGIDARNYGHGDLAVTIDGEVTGEASDGLYAVNDTYFGSGNSQNLTISTGAQSNITGGEDGIDARNRGDGDLTITADGEVTGQSGDGIFATNDYYYDVYNQVGIGFGRNLTVVTGAQSIVTGTDEGIEARNFGTGDLEVTADGMVSGTSGHGILALNYSGSENLTVTTGAESVVTGDLIGISAENRGTGDLIVDVHGDVSGLSSHGVSGINYADDSEMAITTGVGSTVAGGFHGINGVTVASADLAITANGSVTGGGHGILARNSSDSIDITVTIGTQSAVTGGDTGIHAQHFGTGDLAITVNGEVSGEGGDGIYARAANSNANALTIRTGAESLVSGLESGIEVDHSGGGAVDIRINGTVTGQNDYGIFSDNFGEGETRIAVGAGGVAAGYDGGIYAWRISTVEQGIFITNDGVIRNLSGESDDRAIRTRNGATTIDNNGDLIGSVFLSTATDTLNNAGRWSIAGGISDFGGEYDGDVINNSGLIIAADNPAVAVLTIIDNLEVFNNSGVVSLVDGGELDTLNLAALPGDIVYVGQGGKLAVDGFLAAGAAGRSDLLHIAGTTSGITYVTVNLTNPIGSTPNFDGIPVIEVDGTTSQQHFDVEGGVLNAGFFAWDLRLDGPTNTHVLYTTGLGAGSYEFAAGITGAQDIWYQSAGGMLQRQADLRPLIAAALVTPVADFAEPAEPTPVSRVTPGLWFKAVGAWLERDAEEDNNAVTDREQTVYGVMAGFDFGTENVGSQGDALMFGLLAGYLTSDLDFDSTHTEWTYEGPSVGAYATYLDHAFYVDAVVKVDFLDIDIDAEDLAPGEDDADTDAVNFGGQIDTGYKIGFDNGSFVEPQASLAVVQTEIDDIDDIFGGAVEFDDETSVRGRLGLRLGHEHTASNGTIYAGDVAASVWHSFSGDNDVTIFAPLTSATGVSDDPDATFGDVSLGFNVLAPDGWSGFIRGNYAFAADYDAITGNAGVRYAW